jgi:hypothetical protein
MSFRQSNATVAVVIAASLLACVFAIAKPFPPREGCRPVSKIEYNAAKREYLLKSRARVWDSIRAICRRRRCLVNELRI